MGSFGLFWNHDRKQQGAQKWTTPFTVHSIRAADAKTKKSESPDWKNSYKWQEAVKAKLPELIPIFKSYVDSKEATDAVALHAKNDAINKNAKLGVGMSVIMANSRLTAVTQEDCRTLPLNIVWDMIFAEQNMWYGFMTTCLSTQKGACQWSRELECVQRNDETLRPYLRSNYPLTSQLQFIEAVMAVMNPARVTLGLRICFELSTFVEDDDAKKQFEKMLQFLFPEDIFKKKPTLFQISGWVTDSEEQSKFWGFLKEPYINAVKRYDLTDHDARVIVRNRFKAYARTMYDHTVEFRDESEDDRARTFDMLIWPTECEKIMDIAVKAAKAKKQEANSI